MSMGSEYRNDMLIRDMELESQAELLCRQGLWKTADGRVLKITEMSEHHINCTIRMLERKGHYAADSYLKKFRDEQKRRFRSNAVQGWAS
jgi:hypothetical protein